MKTIILTVIIGLLLARLAHDGIIYATTPDREQTKIIDTTHQDIYDIVSKNINSQKQSKSWVKYDKKAIITRYTNVIIKLSKKYSNIDPVVITRIIRTESCFKFWAKGDYWGKKYYSFGPGQIQPRFWSHLLYKVDNSSLGRHLNDRKRKGLPIDYSRYLRRIGYGVEMVYLIVSYLHDKTDGCYEMILTAYGHGWNTKRFKQVQRDPIIVYDKNLKYFSYVRRALL